MILVHDNRCDFCGVCVGVCPENCIDLDESDIAIDEPSCTLCQKCVWVCPLDALYAGKTK